MTDKTDEMPITLITDGKIYRYYRQTGLFYISKGDRDILVSSVTMASDRAIRGLAIETVDVLGEASRHLLNELIQ